MTPAFIPANPVPEGMANGTIKTPDGVDLRFARWVSPASNRGTVCVFAGRGECMEKYFETVHELRERGFAVAMMDWRGQGHSSRQLADQRKGHVQAFEEFELDVETFMHHVVAPVCPPPYFALAHSMGGAVMLRVARSGTRWFDRLVLCAPLIDLPGARASFPTRLLMRALRGAGMGDSFVPGASDVLAGISKFIDNPLTSDPERYARNVEILKRDSTLGIGSPTVAWLDAAFTAIADFRAADFPARIDLPVLILAASEDVVVSTPAIEKFSRRLPAGSYVLIAGARHEILQEQDCYRAQFWTAFDAFMPDVNALKSTERSG